MPSCSPLEPISLTWAHVICSLILNSLKIIVSSLYVENASTFLLKFVLQQIISLLRLAFSFYRPNANVASLWFGRYFSSEVMLRSYFIVINTSLTFLLKFVLQQIILKWIAFVKHFQSQKRMSGNPHRKIHSFSYKNEKNKTPQSNWFSTGEKWTLLLDNGSIISLLLSLVNNYLKIFWPDAT